MGDSISTLTLDMADDSSPVALPTSSGLVVLAREPGMMWKTQASVPEERRS